METANRFSILLYNEEKLSFVHKIVILHLSFVRLNRTLGRKVKEKEKLSLVMNNSHLFNDTKFVDDMRGSRIFVDDKQGIADVDASGPL